MTALPPATDFTGASVTEAGFKTATTDQRSFLAGLLGTDGLIATARSALGLGSAAVLTAGTADADLPTNTNLKGTARAYTKQQTFTALALTDVGTIAWDLDDSQMAKVTLAGNRTLGAPTNMKDGGTYVLRVTQDGTGTRTLVYNAVYKWPSGTAPTLSTGGGDVDILTFTSDGTSMFGVAQLDFG